ncbi:hypothetical protein Sjap_000846 [Stephania japonica]|uniref:PORR domain-containing protein n=1 Tax=Stephania japonica TaxID=461633 RepID=A0AAP0KIW2_9MAGN
MKLRRTLLSSLLSKNHHPHPLLQQWRSITKVRLKWVKNRGLDHIIDRESDLKAACLLKDAIKHSPTQFLNANTFSEWQKHLGLTIPVLRFIRRYPTLFHEFPNSRYPSLPCFRLTDTALQLDSLEQTLHQSNESDTVDRLCRLIMMTNSKMLPFKSLHPLKWDLGLPHNLITSIVPKYPDRLKVVRGDNGVQCLSIGEWRDEIGVSELQRRHERDELKDGYREFKRARAASALAFPMSFPRGYGAQKKVKAWMDEFHKLPYISPYEDSSGIDPESDLMEKRVVGVLHEILSLTIHKKTKRNYLRALREELNLPHRFTRVFTRYPGIFYLSLKCKTTTVALREGYQRGKVVNPHPLVNIREKYYYVMKTGLLYRGKGVDLTSDKNCVLDDDGGDAVDEHSDEGVETDDEYCEDDVSSDVGEESDEEE